MNKVGINLNTGSGALRDGDNGTPVDFSQIVGILYRRQKTIFACIAILVFLGLAATATSPKYYDARALVLLDQNIEKTTQQVVSSNSDSTNDVAMESARLVLLSDEVAIAVAQRLDLVNEPAFMSPPVAPLTKIIGGALQIMRGTVQFVLGIFLPEPPQPVSPANLLTPGSTVTSEDAVGPAVAFAASVLQAQLSVSRVGKSSAFSIYYRSADPTLSANIVNTFADVYVSDVLNANYEATERMTEWMQGRLSELERNAQEAASAAEKFRADNALASGSNAGAMSEDVVDRLNNELSTAITDLARARAMTTALTSAVEAGQEPLLVGLLSGLPAIEDEEFVVRQKFLSDSLIDLRTAIDVGNEARVTANRNRVQQAANRLYSTMQRLVEQARGDVSLAEARVAALRDSLSAAVTDDAAAGPAEVQLEALEQRAATLNTLYQSYLTRFREIDQQRDFPVSNVRVLNYAVGLPRAAGPSLKRAVVLCFVLGLILAAFVIALKEWRDRFVRTSDHVIKSIGVPFLGYLPDMAKPQSQKRDDLATDLASRTQPTVNGRSKSAVSDLLFARKNMRSQYAETLRNIVLTSNLSTTSHERGRVIGITSSRPQEGKSLTSLNLATSFELSGKSVCVVDSDPHRAGLTATLGLSAASGLLDVLSGAVNWEDSLVTIPTTKVKFLQCIIPNGFTHGSEMLASAKMHELILSLRAKFDIVILDLAPMGPVIDTRALLNSIDQLVFVAEWGKTSISLVQGLLTTDHEIENKLLGVVLNKVDIAKMGEYASDADSVTYFNEYNAYIN